MVSYLLLTFLLLQKPSDRSPRPAALLCVRGLALFYIQHEPDGIRPARLIAAASGLLIFAIAGCSIIGRTAAGSATTASGLYRNTPGRPPLASALVPAWRLRMDLLPQLRRPMAAIVGGRSWWSHSCRQTGRAQAAKWPSK